VTEPAVADLRQRRRDFTADEIERAAIELFAERGFTEVTVDEIAEAAGISPRTFFRYFPTKAHVVGAHRKRINHRLVRAFQARPASESTVIALKEAFLSTAKMRSEDRERTVLVGRLLTSPDPLVSNDVGYDLDHRAEMVNLVAKRYGVNPAKDMRPAILVGAMGAAAQTAFVTWLDRGGRGELAELMAEAIGVVMVGLAAIDRPPAAISRKGKK